MKIVLLPVKGFSNAKQRLAGTLDPDQRKGLAQAMLRDVLAAVQSSRSIDQAVVYTASEEVGRIARAHGLEVTPEIEVGGHSSAVNLMARRLSGTASAILAIASDLPTLTGAEIDEVLDSDPEGLVLLASRDGTGTNGVLMRPGAMIDMEYGVNSLKRHVSLAQAGGLAVDVRDVAGFSFDVDTPEDLAHLIEVAPRGGETWRSVKGMGVIEALETTR